MAKGQSPLLGFNTNVRHKGRVFHIQTEDSGISHPHIITHLFADGGRILKSIKTPYGELLPLEDWVPQVKKIMQDQHKAMFIALRDGQYDSLIDGGSPARTTASQSGQHPAATPATPTGQHVAAAASPQPTATPAAATPAATGGPVVSPSGSGPAIGKRPSSPAIQVVTTAGAATTGPQQPVQRPSTAGMPSVQGPSAVNAVGAGPASNRSGRYGSVRAPEVLTSFKPKSEPGPTGGNIFGDSLMSEKSLDEVILAYLAEDLDDKKR